MNNIQNRERGSLRNVNREMGMQVYKGYSLQVRILKGSVRETGDTGDR